MRNIQGFTLVELMVVVAIIGILAAISLPAYQDYIARSQMSEAIIMAAEQKSIVSVFWWNKGVAPSSNTDAGLSSPSQLQGRYVASISIGANGVITATMKSAEVAQGIQGKSITLIPTFPTDGQGLSSISWDCASNAAPQYLPAGCR